MGLDPVTGALIVGGVAGIGGAVGQAISGNAQAEAQQKIAEEQVKALEKARKAAMKSAKPTAAELSQISRQISEAESGIARQERLLAAVDPALIESGKQALALLRGEDAQALAPVRAERAAQRAELVNQLRGQLGAGFETSTAGQAALRNFDRETTTLVAGTQQATLGELLGTARAVRPNPFGGVDALASGTQAMQNLAGRRVAAATGAPFSIAPFGGSAIGDLGRAQAQGAMFGGLGQLGGTLIGLGATKKLFPGLGEG